MITVKTEVRDTNRDIKVSVSVGGLERYSRHDLGDGNGNRSKKGSFTESDRLVDVCSAAAKGAIAEMLGIPRAKERV